jgi:hypothetical protein
VLLAPGFAVPAQAQTTEQESEQEGESGDADQSGEVLNEGDNANQCVAVQPVSNTGNAITDIDIVLQLPTGQDVKRFDTQDVLDLIDVGGGRRGGERRAWLLHVVLVPWLVVLLEH